MTEGRAPGPRAARSASARALLERYPVLRPPLSTAGAAVTIVLRDGGSDVEALLIERAERAGDPASGEVALPGGRVETGDGSLVSTALRELREEVGLGSTDLAGAPRFVGCETARRFDLRVAIFAAELAGSAGTPTVGSPREVAHVFWLPRERLTEASLSTRATDRGPLRVVASVHDGHVVWGFTRRVLRDFFGLPVEDDLVGPLFAPKPGSSTEAPPARSDVPGPGQPP